MFARTWNQSTCLWFQFHDYLSVFEYFFNCRSPVRQLIIELEAFARRPFLDNRRGGVRKPFNFLGWSSFVKCVPAAWISFTPGRDSIAMGVRSPPDLARPSGFWSQCVAYLTEVCDDVVGSFSKHFQAKKPSKTGYNIVTFPISSSDNAAIASD